MTLRSLRWAHESELGIVELTRGDQLARLLNRRGDAAQVREPRDVVQTIQNLADTILSGAARLGRAEVARGQARLQTHLQIRGLDHLVDVADIENLLEVPSGLPTPTVNLL